MLKTLGLVLAFSTLPVMAATNCYDLNGCTQDNPTKLDLRSNGARMLQESEAIQKSVVEVPSLNEEEFKKLVGKDGTQYFVPIDIRKEDMRILMGALSLGVVVFANDKSIMNFVQDHKVEQLDPVVNVGNILGTTGAASIVAGSYFIGAVMKDGKLKQVGLFGLGAGLATQLVTEIFKRSFGRVRPNETDSPYDFYDGGKSFFSGHTSAAFSIATVVAEVYKDKPIIPYLAYGAATITAYARMHDKKHWGSDVLAGATAGTLITRIFMRYFENNDQASSSGLILIPEIREDRFGRSNYAFEVHWHSAEKKEQAQCTKMGLTGESLIRTCFEEALSR